ncbi:MAG: hypothetical protein U1F76_30275 [Candidatus Competibacteraceae bacterium]
MANSYRRTLSLITIICLQLTSCGDQSVPTIETGKPVSTTASQSEVDPLAPRYKSNWREGIDFRRPGYPEFLAEVQGMSSTQELWGRRSNGTLTLFRFKQPLPKQFTLVIKGGALGPNIGKPVRIKVGDTTKDITFVSDPLSRPERYHLDFTQNTSANTIEFIIPQLPALTMIDNPESGIGLISLSIKK